jgi:hypothetical protein
MPVEHRLNMAKRQTLVKRWSNAGQTLVERWSNAGRTLVERTLQSAAASDPAGDAVLGGHAHGAADPAGQNLARARVGCSVNTTEFTQ